MQNLNDYIKFLGLTKPVVVRINSRSHMAWDGYYLPRYNGKGKLTEHRITLYLQDQSRDFNTILAHELIHAWQEEHNKTECHGWHFKRIAKKMGKHFDLSSVYIKGTDI
jgi:hypothetical protein